MTLDGSKYNGEFHNGSPNGKGTLVGPNGAYTIVGEFKNGVGEFYCQDTFNGRTILIRYVWSGITQNSAHFEQSFSEDGGQTWEVNWITDQTRATAAKPN